MLFENVFSLKLTKIHFFLTYLFKIFINILSEPT